MCGIAGIIYHNQRNVAESDLRQMMQSIKHRGPDDEGLFIDKNVGLGFVRLSILDLSEAGHQPMFSHDGKLVIVFNGEVYNYIEIREELKKDFEFKTGTDTEVILAAFQKWGDECLEKFNGMFSFVIYNLITKEVFGARDRFGIKPFYYYTDEDRFIFASELKAIIPFIKREPNNSIIADYLLYNRVDHTNETFFKSIFKLPHGTSFTLNNSNISLNRWYKLSEKIKTCEELDKEKYRELFNNSLKLRQRADVPIGVTLSGGIDSSSITAALRNDFSIEGLNTFSSVFSKEDSADESEFIMSFKESIRNMHFVSPDETSFMNDIQSFIKAHNEPIPDTSPYIQYKVMELASKNVTVTLDGQGADEQLAGYHNFFSIYFLELMKKGKFLTLIKELAQYFKKHKNAIVILYLIYYLAPKFIQNKLSQKRFPSINKSFTKKYKGNSNILSDLYKPKNLNDSLYQHFENKLEHLLKWEDLNSMRFSIESRVPFLDHNLVEATLKSPSNCKIKSGETKHILREALIDILPEKVILRKDKKGFESPQAKWFRSPALKEYIYNILTSDRFKAREYVDGDIALKQFNAHMNGIKDNSIELWKLINLELWHREFIDS
jgi:asparagine synthase (glutamine-hydrolysing)